MDHICKCKAQIGGKLEDLGRSNEFLDTTPKVYSMKDRNDKLDFIKIKNCLLKTMSRDGKTSHRLGENIYRRHI